MSARVDSVPVFVLGGGGLMMFDMVAVTGIRILANVDFKTNPNNLYIVAISIGAGVIPLVASGILRTALSAVLRNSISTVARVMPPKLTDSDPTKRRNTMKTTKTAHRARRCRAGCGGANRASGEVERHFYRLSLWQ